MNVVAALAGLAAWELLFALFLGKWLSSFWFFRIHGLSVVGLLVVAAGSAISYVEFHGLGSQEGVVRQGEPRPRVALTFDDGPHPVYTAQVLDILGEHDIKATFFLVGRHVLKYPETAKRIEQEGHDIGNHTFTHKDLLTAKRRILLSEVDKTDEAIYKITGVQTKLFRPPRGALGPACRRALVEKGYRIVLWTVSAADWSGISPKAIAARVLRYTKPGGIVLFHDSGALVRSEGASRGNTVKALAEVIEKLRAKGFEIVPVSSMLSDLAAAEALALEDGRAAQAPSLF